MKYQGQMLCVLSTESSIYIHFLPNIIELDLNYIEKHKHFHAGGTTFSSYVHACVENEHFEQTHLLFKLNNLYN